MPRLDTVETHSITAFRWHAERDLRPKGEAHIRPDPRVTLIMLAPSRRRTRRSRVGRASAHVRHVRRAGAGLYGSVVDPTAERVKGWSQRILRGDIVRVPK
jgi:hypothetical protein